MRVLKRLVTTINSGATQRPSGPIPAFASLCRTLESKCRNQRTTGNFMSLVELLNLTFERELAAAGTQMSNSLH
jgi:hypothetical protein